MSDGGFLSEQEPQVVETSAPVVPPVPEVTSAPTPVAPAPEVPQAVVEVSPAQPVIDLGEDEDALAERQAVQQMEDQQETFLEMGPDGVSEVAADSSASPEQAEASAASAVPVVVPKDDVTIEVEKILEQGLQQYFQTMPEPAQARFRQKGVEAADKIAGMVRSFHVTVKTVLRLIRDWLMTIPGVNKFFLEQEAKIKTDQIIELEQARREAAQNSVQP
ncbi:hypothetical protein EXS71_01845 [Candidatus Uhrbacteria bacterium]|nr:hypothetical protein [Candidatus Uhrbacteria bacterium]